MKTNSNEAVDPAKHTIGPWKVGGHVRKCEIGGFTTVEATTNSPIGYIARKDDARLIAAAPRSAALILRIYDHEGSTHDRSGVDQMTPTGMQIALSKMRSNIVPDISMCVIAEAFDALLEGCRDALSSSVDARDYPDGPCVRTQLRAAITKAEGTK